MFPAVSILSSLLLLLSQPGVIAFVVDFVPPFSAAMRGAMRKAATGGTSTALNYRNKYDNYTEPRGAPTPGGFYEPPFGVINTATRSFHGAISSGVATMQRNDLKRQLMVAAIEQYDASEGESGAAEDIMRQLEQLKPWPKPAHNPALNARWSFVFTGVPTIGMKLITLLSRISVGVPPVDFQDVYLEVRELEIVKANVTAKFFGVPIELIVRTKLQPNSTDSAGTYLVETFQSITVAGINIPTPASWHKSRSLEISYLDDDVMIARTAGGDPHFLLRHDTSSWCADKNDDDEDEDELCSVDVDESSFMFEARKRYGEKLGRSLVDRAYGSMNDDHAKNVGADVIELIRSILDHRSGGH